MAERLRVLIHRTAQEQPKEIILFKPPVIANEDSFVQIEKTGQDRYLVTPKASLSVEVQTLIDGKPIRTSTVLSPNDRPVEYVLDPRKLLLRIVARGGYPVLTVSKGIPIKIYR